MALNCSHQPVFPAHISEDNFVSPARIMSGYFMEGIPEKNGENYSSPWHLRCGETEEQNISCGWDRVDHCSSSESTSEDVVDLLPSDPFGMDIETTVTAITGWLEDLGVDYRGRMGSNSGRGSQQDYSLFADWNLFWNHSLELQPFHSTIQSNEKLPVGARSFLSDLHGNEKSNVGNSYFESSFQFREVLHDAWTFVLSYLGMQDLLSVERVCKSLFDTLKRDYWLWSTIHIDQPLNAKITDDVLVLLAGRAKGNLQCLSLVECSKVTDDGLRHVLETNPCLNKLCIPGCTRITIECIVSSIKAFNSNKDVGGIKHVRIGGLKDVNHEHFEELKLLLGVGDKKIESHHNPHFYRRWNPYLPYDDDRAIDIEICPRCEQLKLVYDCPIENCKVKGKSPQVCRACTICIARCAQCGRCINGVEFEETFCLELVCSDCFEPCQNKKLDKKVDPAGGQHDTSLDG